MSDMTEIDVPDWVVKAAEDARVRCLNAVTAYGSAGVDERYHMAMKAAITAALGAWVVPMAWAGTDFPNWRRHESEQVRKLTRKAQPQHGFITPLYTLRQEKPE